MRVGFTIEVNLPDEMADEEFQIYVDEIKAALLQTARGYDLDGATVEVT